MVSSTKIAVTLTDHSVIYFKIDSGRIQQDNNGNQLGCDQLWFRKAKEPDATASDNPTASGSPVVNNPFGTSAPGAGSQGAPNTVKISYVADSSAKLEPIGFKRGPFPAMQTDDPTDPTRGKPVYFDLHTGKTIHFLVDSAQPLTKLSYTGVAFNNFSIEVRTSDGNFVASAGPFDYGNKQNTIEVPLPGITQFEVIINDQSRDWVLMEEMHFETAGTTPGISSPPAPVFSNRSQPGAISSALTEDQARAVVLIQGDNAEGTGFMIKTPGGPAVVTNLHVIANNPNLKITTNTGALVTVLSEKGASDRDLALLAIKDANYSYLEMAPDISQIVQPGDEVITPGNSEGGEVMLNTAGKVLGIGPERIEFDNPIYHGNSGGPVFHVKSGKVLGVVTEATKVDVSDELDKASFASRNSAISGSMRYFGLRLDTVSAWVPVDSQRFQVESAFLDQFDKRSRCLDCYINAPDDNKPEDTLWQDDPKIVKANNDCFDQRSGADTSQQMDAITVLWSEISDIADTDMDAIQNPSNFYSFDQQRAKDEIAYRKALKTELNEINNNVSRLGGLPRSNN
jgi:S1-C subfamily serine protease